MNGSTNGKSHIKTRIASPWVLGLYGLAGATFVVATHMARWYGRPESLFLLVPFVAVFGGLAQLLAAMWAYAADDVLATAMLGTWGSFWIGYGLLNALVGLGKLPAPQGAFPELAFWFIATAAITWVGAAAAARENAGLVGVFALFASGSTIAAIANGIGLEGLGVVAAWFFIVAAIVAWYTASAMMLNQLFDREVLALGRSRLEMMPARRAAPGVSESVAARRVG